MPQNEMASGLLIFGAGERSDDDPTLLAREFEIIYSKFSPMVHGVIVSKVPYDDAADVVQEVFAAAFHGMSRLRNKDAVGPWLIRIARNLTAEYYRKRRQTVEIPEDVCQPQGRSTEALEVLRVIRSLPDAYSETLSMRLIEGMTGKEISEQTGLKPESVRVNLHRGMEMLRASLGIEVRKTK